MIPTYNVASIHKSRWKWLPTHFPKMKWVVAGNKKSVGLAEYILALPQSRSGIPPELAKVKNGNSARIKSDTAINRKSPKVFQKAISFN